jgi:hypothetical protein
MRACAACGGAIEERFRFCPWCAAPLRRKLVELFRAGIEADRGRALRVSRYLDEGHVRFSVWDRNGEARAAVSLDEEEAARLARFLRAGATRPRSRLERLLPR